MNEQESKASSVTLPAADATTLPVDCISLSAIAAQLAFYQARDYPADEAVHALLEPWGDEEIYFTQGYAERVLVEIGLSHRIQHLVDSGAIRLYDAAARGPMATRYDALVSVREVREKLAAQGTLPAALAAAIHEERESKVWLWQNMTDFEKRNIALREAGPYNPLHLHEWFKHDTWDVDTAMTLLVGLDPTQDRLVTTKKGDSEELLCGWYLDGSVVDFESWVAANIVRDASSKQLELPADEFDSLISLEQMQLWGRRRHLLAIWHSGKHEARNPPADYIEWALAKQHYIPWLDWARDNYRIAAAVSDAGTPEERREKARQVLAKHDGVYTKAAAELGISRQRLQQLVPKDGAAKKSVPSSHDPFGIAPKRKGTK